MISRRTVGLAVGLVILCVLVAVPARAQQQPGQPSPRKLDKVQQADDAQLTKLVDDAMTPGNKSQPPKDFDLTFAGFNFLKAATGATYVPYSLAVEPGKLTNQSVSLLVRIVKKGTLLPPAPKEAAQPIDDRPLPGMAADVRANDERPIEKPKPRITPEFEDLAFLDLKKDQPKFNRAFQVAPGDYDIYVAFKERGGDKKKPAKMTLLKQTLTVPSFEEGLALSSIIMFQRADKLAASLTPDQQREHPYAFGNIELVPQAEATYKKTDQMQFFFQVFNPAIDPATKRPNLVVQYNFFVKSEGGLDKPFNSTAEAPIEAPAQAAKSAVIFRFDGVPLESFPSGEYRLEIRVTDRAAKKVVTKAFTFTVQ